jgi:hypothetical protein
LLSPSPQGSRGADTDAAIFKNHRAMLDGSIEVELSHILKA